jgi:hypothetical protein
VPRRDPPGVCAGRQEAKRQKTNKEKERRVEVQNMRHPQTFRKRQRGESLFYSAFEHPSDYKQRKKIKSKKKRAPAAADAPGLKVD